MATFADVEAMRVMLRKDEFPEAKLPIRGSPLAAGWDICAAVAKTVPAKGKALISTGFSVATPPGTYARIAPRSGLAHKKFIDVGAGVIDADYRGVVGVILFNFGEEDFAVAPGDRIAQMILEKISYAPMAEVDTLDDTDRGAGGFGSTGVSGGPGGAGGAEAAAAKRQRTGGMMPEKAPECLGFLDSCFSDDAYLNGRVLAVMKPVLRELAISGDPRFYAIAALGRDRPGEDTAADLNTLLKVVV